MMIAGTIIEGRAAHGGDVVALDPLLYPSSGQITISRASLARATFGLKFGKKL